MPELEKEQEIVVECLCPFNNDPAHIDPNGYCEHLLGFTNEADDTELYEPLIPKMTAGGEFSGLYQALGGKHRKPIPPGAKLVNPITLQKVQGITHRGKRWVSSRVYHQTQVRKLPQTDAEDDD